MIPASRGFNSFSSQQSGQSKINSVGERFPINRTLMAVKDADIILFLDSKNPKAELNKLSFKIDSHKVIFIKSKCDLSNSSSNINNTDIY